MKRLKKARETPTKEEKPVKRFLPILKLLAVVVVGLFVLKYVSGALAAKYPNKVTNGVNAVVQAA